MLFCSLVPRSESRACCFTEVMPPFSSVMTFLDDSRLSLTPWSFRTRVSFLSAQLRHEIFVKKQSLEISFPSIDSRLKQVFVFYQPPEVVNFRLKSLLETTFAQSKQICSFDDGDTHTRSIDLVGVESAHSAIEVKDSQMKPETPNASHATPHFSSETSQPRSSDFVACGWPLCGQKRLAALTKRSTCSKSRWCPDLLKACIIHGHRWLKKTWQTTCKCI